MSATDNILRWPEVKKKTGICRSHAHSLATKGKFPKPIKLSTHASGWLESEINQWIADRVAASRNAA